MTITEFEHYDQLQFADLKQLMIELTDKVELTQTTLVSVLKDRNNHLSVMQDSDRIIGCATLCIFQFPTRTKGSIEDVVISFTYRGQHLGQHLIEHVLQEAQRFAPIELHLTSNPKRVAANHLYQSLGFHKKETNCYVMKIE